MGDIVPPSVPEANETSSVENTIQPDVLLALGDKPKGDNQNWGPAIHNEIANRWKDYLAKGIPTEDKQKLIENHPPPANCAPLRPPLLNAEVVAALKSPIIKQDAFLKNLQQLLTSSLTALASPLNKIITDPDTTMDNKTELLPALIDASKALAGAYQSLSLHRRYLITPFLKENHRRTVQDSPIDEQLFGTNLQENLKTSQAVKRMGEELSGQTTKKPRNTAPTNSQPSTSRQNFRKPASKYRQKFQTTNKASDFWKREKRGERKGTKRY